MATRLECAFLEGDALTAWDALVERAPQGTLFHSYRWTALIADTFGRRARVLGVFRNGELVARFGPRTTPDSPEVVAAIEAQLATQ